MDRTLHENHENWYPTKIKPSTVVKESKPHFSHKPPSTTCMGIQRACSLTTPGPYREDTQEDVYTEYCYVQELQIASRSKSTKTEEWQDDLKMFYSAVNKYMYSDDSFIWTRLFPVDISALMNFPDY